MTKFIFRFKGGEGSGHYDHKGRPGKKGGSLPDGENSEPKKTDVNPNSGIDYMDPKSDPRYETKPDVPEVRVPKGFEHRFEKGRHYIEGKNNPYRYQIKQISPYIWRVDFNTGPNSSLTQKFTSLDTAVKYVVNWDKKHGLMALLAYSKRNAIPDEYRH